MSRAGPNEHDVSSHALKGLHHNDSVKQIQPSLNKNKHPTKLTI